MANPLLQLMKAKAAKDEAGASASDEEDTDGADASASPSDDGEQKPKFPPKGPKSKGGKAVAAWAKGD